MSYLSDATNFVGRLEQMTSPNYAIDDALKFSYAQKLSRYRFDDRQWEQVLDSVCQNDYKGFPPIAAIYIYANEVELQVQSQNKEERGKVIFDFGGQYEFAALVVKKQGRWVMAEGKHPGMPVDEWLKMQSYKGKPARVGKRLFGGERDKKYVFPDHEPWPRPEDIVRQGDPIWHEVMDKYNIRMNKWRICQQKYGYNAYEMWDAKRGCEKDDPIGWDVYSQPGYQPEPKSSGEAPGAIENNRPLSWYASEPVSATASATEPGIGNRAEENDAGYWESLFLSGK